ncbi:MAG: penicillin-binding transpeptidase domain-containing protein, partial [Clostridiales bacterium]|nr:penicillin-binding transpeptidase domain-containing protein [Clostridiales bacterium]
LMKPRLVKELVDSNGNIVKRYEPEAIRQVISGSTSDTLSDILEGVVSEGTGKNAYVRGYKVAGKTGTSETTVSGVFTASFMAFAPADNPVICALVVLFDPKGESHMGGAIAAPVAGKLVEDVLNYLEVERRYSERDKEIMSMPVIVPDLKGKSIKDAKVLLKDANLQYRIEGNLTKGEETTVLEQTPKAGASLVEKSTVIIYTYKPENEVMAAVPDLLHKTVDEATEALTRVGLNIKTIGSGVVVVQQYKTGEKVPLGSIVEVEFRYNDNIE